MKPRVFNKKAGDAPIGAVYVGRPTVFGNPFVIDKDGDRDEVVRKYEQYVLNSPWLLKRVRRELAGKHLVCWCAPLRCHADVLTKIANEK